MQSTLLHLKVVLPSHIFADKTDVTRVVFETPEGSFGFLPQRLDCISALVPGILTYESEEEGLSYVAIDQGVLVKAGKDVLISVRDAIEGTDLVKLRMDVQEKFLALDSREKSIRSILAKMESGRINSLVEFHHD